MTKERKAIERAKARRDRIDEKRADATRKLAEACAAARASGIPMTEIAELACLTRDGLYKLLAREGLG
jgi:DNA-binding phage protein